MSTVQRASRALRLGGVLLVVMSLGPPLLACTGIIPGVMPHDVRYDATKLEHDRCDPGPADPRLYGVDIIAKVEPYYRYVMGGPSGGESHLAGAKLELRPLPGVTEELLERALMCRSAQIMLGHAQATSNEPYAFTDSWIKIDVEAGRGAFVVTLAPEDSTRAREVFERARAFASPHSQAIGSPLGAVPGVATQ